VSSFGWDVILIYSIQMPCQPSFSLLTGEISLIFYAVIWDEKKRVG
jgi:hypothetical protein